MDVKRERIVAYCIAITLFVVGVVCYAAFPEKKPEQPIRIMLENTAGGVLFDMKEHNSEDGYEIECMECHHEMEDNTGRPQQCGAEDCHGPEDTEEALKRLEAFHVQCIECHEDDGLAPALCETCHFMQVVSIKRNASEGKDLFLMSRRQT